MRNTWLAVIMLLMAPSARAQSVDERLKDLAVKIEETRRGAADSAAAVKGLQDLQIQVVTLQQEMENQRAVHRGYGEMRDKIDEYEKRIGDLELKLDTLGMRSQGGTAGYDRGFFLQSLDQRFLLKLKGLIQAAYLGKGYGEGRIYSDGIVGKNESTFALRRAALETSGYLFLPQLAYTLALEFGTQDPGPLREAYGELRFHRLLQLRLGKQKVPLGRQFLIGSAQQLFVERSSVTSTFSPGWDLGAMLSGEAFSKSQLSYQIGMFNGAGPSQPANENIDFLYAARVVYAPLGDLPEAEEDQGSGPFRLALGASFVYNLARTDIALRTGVTDPLKVAELEDGDGDGEVDNVSVYMAAAEVTARLHALVWQTEGFFRLEDPGAVGSNRSFLGIYSQVGLCPVYGNLELAVRYGYWEPHYYGQDRQNLLAQKIHELAAVVNLLTWGRLVKWQVEYAHQWEREFRSTGTTLVEKITSSRVRLQLQVEF